MPQTHTRGYVLDCSVKIEALASELICLLLNVDYLNSTQFGRNAKIDFTTKINIISEFKTLSKGAKRKFVLLAEIRNKFAHRVDITTFVDCFNIKVKEERELAKFYPFVSKPDRESNLKELFRVLQMDCELMLTSLKRSAEYEKKNSLSVELQLKCAKCGNIVKKKTVLFSGYLDDDVKSDLEKYYFTTNAFQNDYCINDKAITKHYLISFLSK